VGTHLWWTSHGSKTPQNLQLQCWGCAGGVGDPKLRVSRWAATSVTALSQGREYTQMPPAQAGALAGEPGAYHHPLALSVATSFVP
jgi:hypothetical protein